jgi:hypothetical protein
MNPGNKKFPNANRMKGDTMKKQIYIFLLSSISLLLSFTAGCQDTGSFALSGKASTLGVGPELSAKLATDINVRVGFNTLDFDFDDEDIDDVEYDLGVDLSSVSAMVDWHIFDDPFRITGGFISMHNKIDLDARPSKNVEIGYTTYTPAQIGTLNGSMDIDGLSPYLGIGWGNPFAGDRRWGFTLDMGLAFTDSPDVKLYSTGIVSLADLEKERRDIEDDFDSLRIYPVISLGLFFRF